MQRIYLNTSWALLHEYIHVILRQADTGHIWRAEGLTDYLAQIVYPYSYNRVFFEEENMLHVLSNNGDDNYVNTIREIYYIYTGNELTDLPNMRALIDAYSYALLLDSDEVLHMYLAFLPIYQRYNVKPDNEGNELSLPQATSLIAFLVDTYSFETVLKLNESWVSVESIFGKSYEELREDWILWLSRGI